MAEKKHNHGTFLPDFCNVRTVFVIILLAELLAFVVSLSQNPYIYTMAVDLAMNSLFIQWVALSSTALLCLFRNNLHNISEKWVAGISYLTTLLITLIVSEIAWYAFVVEFESQYISSDHVVFITRVMSISAIVWALALRYFYINHQWKMRIESESNARFQALQSRIKPHFLFNCMNTIAGLIRRTPDLAEESIEDLADLFRASLQDSRNSSTLEDEITLCKRYLRIEQHRLGNRLRVDWDLEGIPHGSTLPLLCIQPLIENAIYHGIEPNPDGGTISITGKQDNGKIIITISNPVTPHNAITNTRTGNRVAQDNISQRLASFFNEDNLLSVSQQEDRYNVTVIIPDQ